MKPSEKGQGTGGQFEFAPFRLDTERRLLLREGEAVPVSRKALETLLVLVEQQGQVVSKEELMRRVWPDAFVEENSLNQCISVLRKTLGDTPGVPRYIETVTGRGYRFVAAVSMAHPARIADRPPRSLAILPLRTLGPEKDEWLGTGIADTLITRLSNVHDLVVRPTSSVLRYAASEASPVEAGRELEVDAVLEGSIRRAGDRIRVTVQLVSVGSGAPIWAGTFDERFTEIFAVEDSISQRVAEALTSRLSVEERTLLTRRATENSEVYRLYLNGRWFANRLTPEGSARAIECLRQAVELEPGYALGHAGLAYHFIQCADLSMPSREAMTLAEEAANRALAIDESLSDARSTLAMVYWQYRWDEGASLREFERAVAMDPRNAHGYLLYGWCLMLMGRFEQGLAALRRARELDPLSHENALYTGPGLYLGRRFDEALACVCDSIDRDASLWLTHVMLGRILEVRGDLDGAIASYEKGVAVAGPIAEGWGDLGRALGRAGLTARAREVLATLESRAVSSHVPAFTLANVHFGLGDLDRAFALLEQAIDDRSWYVTWLQVDPLLDELRGDGRFAGLLTRIRPLAQ